MDILAAVDFMSFLVFGLFIISVVSRRKKVTQVPISGIASEQNTS
jgi:hypothetical protein